jgi:pimeloyl-ACP methyl ester carboxylesterase
MPTGIQFKQYLAKKGPVELFIYRKFNGSAEGKPVLFLVHGSSLSALPSYDLQVPGRGSEYSMMDRCAQRGFDVWTMDHEGYGRSTRTSNNSNIAQGVDDLQAAMPIVERESGRSRFHFYGQSSGSLRTALFAQTHSDRIDRLVLDAFVWTGKDSPTLIERREQLDRWRASHIRTNDRAMLNSIFTHDKSGASETVVADAAANAQLAYGETVPSGTYLDMCAHLPVVDPEKLNAPILIVRGEHDGIATMEDLASFFVRLPNSDKQITVLPSSAHIALFGLNAHRFFHVLFAFLEMPARRGGS